MAGVMAGRGGAAGEDPAGAEDWLGELNPQSLEVVPGALASPPLLTARPGDRCLAAAPDLLPPPPPSSLF